MAFVVAAALVRGQFTLAELEADAIADPAICRLATKLDYRIDESSGFPQYYSGELRIAMVDGTVVSHREHVNRGSGARPLQDDEVRQKYVDNATRVVSRAQADRIAQAVLEIDRAPDIGPLVAALRFAGD